MADITRSGRTAIAIICAVALMAGFLMAGCGTSQEEAYRTEWKDTMEGFFKKLDADDKKAEKLSAENDIGGVIQLVNQRIEAIETALEEMLQMNPPAKYKRLHVQTMYFMLALIDQLEAQNELNKAVVSGQPTEDLSKKVEIMNLKLNAVGQELSVEQLSVGIVIDVPELERSGDTAPSEGGQSSSPAGGQ